MFEDETFKNNFTSIGSNRTELQEKLVTITDDGRVYVADEESDGSESDQDE